MKRKPIIASIIIVEIIAVLTAFFLYNNKNKDTYELPAFYSRQDGEALHYIDSTYDDDRRSIESDGVTLDKGFYLVELYYQSNFPLDGEFGCSAYLNSFYKDIRILPMEKYVYLDESGTASFQVYIPYDGCKSEIVISMEDDNGLRFINDEARYILVDHAIITEDTFKTACFLAIKLLVVLLLFDLALFYYFCIKGLNKADNE